MRDALSLTDQAIAFGAGALSEDGVRQMLGAVDRGHAVRIVEAIAAVDGAALVGAVDALRGLGLSAAGTLEEMAALLQQMAVLQAVPDAVDAGDPDAPEAQRLAALIAADETQLLYSIALHGRAEIGLAPDEYSGLVMVLLRMLAFRPKGEGAAMRGPAVPTAVPAPRSAPVAAAARPAAAPARPPASAPARVGPAPVVAQPAAVAPAPALRVPAAASEPPPWMDDAPFEEEVVEHEALAVRAPAPPPYAEKPAAFTPTALGGRWAELVGSLNEARQHQRVRARTRDAGAMRRDRHRQRRSMWRLRVERESLRAPAVRQAADRARRGWSGRCDSKSKPARSTTRPRSATPRSAHGVKPRPNRSSTTILSCRPDAQYKTARIVPGSVKPMEIAKQSP